MPFSVVRTVNTASSANERGITLVEILVSIAIFASLGVGIYSFFDGMLTAIQSARTRANATALLREQLEIVRNLPYDDVGTVGGIPAGVLAHSRSVTHGGQAFVVTTTVRNVDDPFDGIIGGTPNDLSPADYKLIEIEVSCPTCRVGRLPIRFTTTQAPKGLETASTNGALFVQVIDSAGLPVPGATVAIINDQVSPAVTITDVTGIDGWLRIIDAPPGANAYEIAVTKDGYSADRTYTPGADGNLTPTKPHATVVVQTVTQITFSIDQTSTVSVSSVTEACEEVPFIGFSLTGAKIIGTPNVLKYDEQHQTGDIGTLTLTNMEWDSYAVALTGGSVLRGLIPLNPLSLGAGVMQTLRLIVGEAAPNAILVTIKDAATLLPIPDASVTLGAATLITGRGHLGQTDWSGGDGQERLADDTSRYWESDGNIATDAPDGELKLRLAFEDEYMASGWLVSSTIDTGSESNFHELVWEPLLQPSAAGEHSARFQLATNLDDETWEFLGPDGTIGSFYTASERTIASIHNGDRYVRYRVELSTEDPAYTPSVSDVHLTFTSECVPPGQATFAGLGNGTYAISVQKDGYQTFTDDVSVGSPWSETVVILTPS